MSVLASRSRRSLLLFCGALLLAVVLGALVAYSERFGGDNGPYMLLGALLTIVVAVAVLLRWHLGAILLVAAIPFESAINRGALVSGMKVLALLTFFSFAMALLTDHKLFERFVRLWQQPLALAMLAFVLWISVSILWASDTGEALRTVVTFLGLLSLMVVIGSLERRYVILAWTVLVFSAALSVPAGYILPVPASSDMAVSGRFGPGGAGPNTYSLVVAIAFFIAYFGLLRRHRIIAHLLAPVFLYGIFATGSRTGLIALVATPLLALCVPRLAARLGWRIPSLYVLGATAVVVMALAIPSVAQNALERYTTLSQIQSEDTWNGRTGLWEGALNVIASHPIMGVGAGNYAEAAYYSSETVQRHANKKAATTGEITAATHDVFLDVASELGLVGVILYLGVLCFLYKTAVRIARRSNLGTGIFLGLIVAMIAGLTQPWEDEKMVYVLFGSVLALQLHDSARRSPPLSEQKGSRG